MNIESIQDLNPTPEEVSSLNKIYLKLPSESFPGTRFKSSKDQMIEMLFRNGRCCMAEKVNPAVVLAEAIIESGWFSKTILFGIKATEQEVKYDNADYKITHEIVDDAGLMHYKQLGVLIDGARVGNKWNCKIKDWFYVPNKAFDNKTFMAMHFDRYYDFMANRAFNHGFKLEDVSKTVDKYIDFLMAKDEENHLYPYATGVNYGQTVKSVISDNGLEAFNKY